jgi:hypothetical protein
LPSTVVVVAVGTAVVAGAGVMLPAEVMRVEVEVRILPVPRITRAARTTAGVLISRVAQVAAMSPAQGYYGGGYRGGAAYGGRPGGYPGGYYHHGYSTGAYWGGGYWRGGYWPRAYYGYGYSWFLPVLPLAYATYWYSGVPYYYANDVYYTWNPDYSGYTATDPPPVIDSSADASGSAAPSPDAGAVPGAGDTGAGAGAQIFMYPKNGQTQEQQSTDKRECQEWAASQAGAGASNGSDYRRAMMACVEGRGYSAN